MSLSALEEQHSLLKCILDVICDYIFQNILVRGVCIGYNNAQIGDKISQFLHVIGLYLKLYLLRLIFTSMTRNVFKAGETYHARHLHHRIKLILLLGL